MRAWLTVSVGALLALSQAAGATSRPSSASAPPPGMTRSGQLLWNFEALLWETFGSSKITVRTARNRALNFVCAGDCYAPALHYRFTFMRPRGSAFHVSRRAYRGEGFGNYPRAILIRGRFIACDESERRFLISWVFASTASFTLGCSTVEP